MLPSIKRSLLTTCLLAIVANCASAQVVPLSDPDNTGNWVLNESVSDEFNGDSLDKKWTNLGLNGDYENRWKGRAPSQYNPANVKVGGGNLTITSKWDPSFNFVKEKGKNGFTYGKPAPVTCGCVISKAKFKHGYMEMRCKAADGPVSSSFWTTGPGGELDVFEHFGENPSNKWAANLYQASFHDWRKGSPMMGKRIWTNEHQLDFRVADDFHVYAMEWDAKYVRVFVDGRLINCVTKEEMGDKWVADNEQMVWIDSETFDWQVKPDKIKASDFGDGQDFVVDYCRIWQRKGGAGGKVCQDRTNLLSNGGFESGMDSWKGPAKASRDANSGKGAAEMKTGGVIEQTVTVKPDTTYVLSAWVRSPGTNERNLWFNNFLGAKGFGGEKADVRYFFPYYHQKSVQFTTGPNATRATIFFSNKPQGKPAVIDDIELVEANAAGE